MNKKEELEEKIIIMKLDIQRFKNVINNTEILSVMENKLKDLEDRLKAL